MIIDNAEEKSKEDEEDLEERVKRKQATRKVTRSKQQVK